MYSVYDIAEYVIKRCNEQGKSISNLKLQKILYFIQAEFLVRTGEPIFEEAIEAWDFGPVVPCVYRKYKIFGGASIPYYECGKVFSFDSSSRAVLDDIINSCADFSAAQLVDMTHKQTPWKNAYASLISKVIPTSSIKEYFDEVMKNAR